MPIQKVTLPRRRINRATFSNPQFNSRAYQPFPETYPSLHGAIKFSNVNSSFGGQWRGSEKSLWV